MMRQPVIRSLSVFAAAALTAVLAGCSPFGTVCPAIGYVSSIEVRIAGDVSAVQRVELCLPSGDCMRSADAHPQPSPSDDGTMVVVTPGASPTPIVLDSEVAPGRWRFSVVSNVDSATATAYRIDGTVAGETTDDLHWRRVGGSAQCGGPTASQPIVIDVD